MNVNRKALICESEYESIRAALLAGEPPESGQATLGAALAALDRIKSTFQSYEPETVERAARLGRDGELEIDDGAVCSRGEDSGCYVQAWLWVPDKESRT